MMFADDENVGVHSFECKCCSGTGKIKDVDVFCGLEQRTVHVMEFTECGCNTCASGGRLTLGWIRLLKTEIQV